jgi:RNA polymerase sigma factor (TIGR02999 family)
MPNTNTSPGEITRLLGELSRGDELALSRLFPMVYNELRGIARRQRRQAGLQETLNTTAVVHEAFLKLAGSERVSLENRRHFFATAARAMRQILVDHARSHMTRKRGGGAKHIDLDQAEVQVQSRAAEILELDMALDRLRNLNERLSRIVELRFFAGLSVEECAELLEVHERTVKRDWRKARAFLFRELGYLDS